MQCCQVDLPVLLFNGFKKCFDGYFVDSDFESPTGICAVGSANSSSEHP